MKRLFALAFLLLWAAWYGYSSYYIRWMEGFSYFSTLPDFTDVHLMLPWDLPRYIGAFILQFYKWPIVGAFIQALLPLISISGLYVVLNRLLKDSSYACAWIAFLFLPVVVYFQRSDLTLSLTVSILLIEAVVFVIVLFVLLFIKPTLVLPKFLKYSVLSTIVCTACIGMSFYLLSEKDQMIHDYNEIARLEYLADNREWIQILETVSSADAIRNEYKRKYVLLALSETGKLPDYAFRYGLSGSEDFMFHGVEEPLCHNFNMLFYRSLGINNAVIYQAFQQGVQSMSGTTFYSMRHLIDACLEAGDYALADKYLEIISHSTLHGQWVKERIARLEDIKDSDTRYSYKSPRFILDSFLADMSSMYDRYPYNKKFADYLLCGVLANKDGNTFYQVFQLIAPNIFTEGCEIPKLYQEALLLIASHEPNVLQRYKIDERVLTDFTGFTELMRAGKVTQAKRKYSGTYWAYIY